MLSQGGDPGIPHTSAAEVHLLQTGAVLSQGGGPDIPHTSAAEVHLLQTGAVLSQGGDPGIPHTSAAEDHLLQTGAVLSQGDDPGIPHTSAAEVHMLEGSTAAPDQSHHSIVTYPSSKAKVDPLEGWAMLPKSNQTGVGDVRTSTKRNVL
jgi:hypothetical protein